MTKFTQLIEAWDMKERRSSGIYWRGVARSDTTPPLPSTTKDPFEALQVDQENVADQLAIQLNLSEPLVIHGVSGKWVSIAHAFDGTSHIQYPDEETIVQDVMRIAKRWDNLAEFMELGRAGDLGTLHHSFGMWLRNHYKLWHAENPHTMKDYVPEIRNGADHSPRHPDNFSMRVIETAYQRLAQEQK